jgi:glycerophosphoryl diester phosphodiesterase
MNLFLQPRSTPLIIAHRGSSAHAPENTLAAFRLAAEQHADAIELDVDLTRDGHVVVMHDATIDRTTNGQGCVTDLTLEEIRRVDAGSWKGAQFAGECVPLLSEVFEAVGQQLLINIEIKGMTLRSTGLEARVIDVIKRYDFFERIIISSFNPLALLRVKRLEPRVACGLLFAPGEPMYLRRAWLAPLIPSLNARHPHHSQVTPAFVEKYHARGQYLYVWTINDVVTARAMTFARVDGIIGDNPVLIRKALEH